MKEGKCLYLNEDEENEIILNIKIGWDTGAGTAAVRLGGAVLGLRNRSASGLKPVRSYTVP